MTTLDLSPYFSNAPTQWELVGTWPTGLSIDSSGVVSGTTTDSGLFPGVQVRCKNDYSAWAYSNTFNVNASKFAALVPAVNYEMKGVGIGTGDLTTTHTSTLYAPDHEGVQRAFAANEPVWSGGRVVRNLVNYSNDLSVGGNIWRAENGGSIDSAIQVTLDAQANSGVYYTIGNLSAGVKNYLATATIRVLSGSGEISLTLQDYGGGYNYGTPVNITATSSFKRFSSNIRVTASGAIGFYLHIRTTNTAGVQVLEIKDVQVEGISGQTNQNPSELVATSGAIAAKTFASENGNTVDGSNVVTEAVGTPLAEMPYLQYYPAATNIATYSYLLTSGFWAITGAGITVVANQVGITGEPNTAWTLTKSSGVATDGPYNTITNVPAGTYTGIYRIKKTTSAASFPAVALVSGGEYVVNTDTGVLTSAGNPATATECISDGGWWKILLQHTFGSSGNQYQSFTPVWNTTGLAARDDAATGSCIAAGSELILGTIAEVRGLGPIFTTTAPVSTDRTLYDFDLANLTLSASSWYWEIEPAWTIAELTTTQNTIGFDTLDSNGAKIVYIRSAQDDIRTTIGGGSNPDSFSPTLVSGTMYQQGLVYAAVDNLHNLNVDGAWSGTGTYNGTQFTRNAIRICAGTTVNLVPMKMREMRSYTTTTYAEGVSLINGLMNSAEFVGGDIIDLTVGDT
jgi:hypothetical protein